MNYAMLEKVIIDTIKEEQIKLGYEKETIRLYYPMSSLAHILDIKVTDTEEMDKLLDGFIHAVEDKLGKIQFTQKSDRYCLIIPPQGAAFVHENYEDNPFLVEFIYVIRNHGCTLNLILEVFHRYSDHVVCEKSNNEEFDYVIYFNDASMEDYRYCLKFDPGHVIYHRFSKKDFEHL